MSDMDRPNRFLPTQLFSVGSTEARLHLTCQLKAYWSRAGSLKASVPDTRTEEKFHDIWNAEAL